jgi:hypothetical protein
MSNVCVEEHLKWIGFVNNSIFFDFLFIFRVKREERRCESVANAAKLNLRDTVFTTNDRLKITEREGLSLSEAASHHSH